MEEYRPEAIQFELGETETPEVLGEFETAEEAAKFLGTHLIGVNHALTATRYMDAYEKKKVREAYRDLLEDTIPQIQKEVASSKYELQQAKDKHKENEERLSATFTEIDLLAKEVKRGTKDIRLDEKYTYRIATGDNYCFYTYIDKKLKLCSVSRIPDSEKQELFNQSVENQNFFENGETE